MIRAAVVGLALLACAAPASAAGLFAIPSYDDPPDALPGTADLRAASFGQTGPQLILKIRVRRAWEPGAQACVVLTRGGPLGRLCATPRAITWSTEPATADAGGATPIAATISQANRRSLAATFYPRELGIPLGPLHWHLETDGDRLPDAGSYALRIGVLGEPHCFGASSGLRCRNPELDRVVMPSPSLAQWMPDAPCHVTGDVHRYSVIEPCEFGALDDPDPQVALIGDSHAAHLRATIEVVAQAEGWRAVSLTHSGCAFSTEVYPAPAPIPERCRVHSAEVLRWLRAHPTVHTVFTSNAAGRGLGVGGFLSEWSQVPATVKRIYEIRDVPRVSYTTAGCVLALMRAHKPERNQCAVPRGSAFPADAAAEAARIAGGRVHLVDLSREFCDSARCYPVIGGAYVYKDFNHINRLFASTLGPPLLKALGQQQGAPAET